MTYNNDSGYNANNNANNTGADQYAQSDLPYPP